MNKYYTELHRDFSQRNTENFSVSLCAFSVYLCVRNGITISGSEAKT
jgi:hypothetical protein